MNDCSTGSGWMVDGNGYYRTGVFEEVFNHGSTDMSDQAYATFLYFFRDHQANVNYVSPSDGQVYASGMQKVTYNCPAVAPHFGTTLNYNGLFYAFQTGTYQGTPC
jgi:hypothetical protein